MKKITTLMVMLMGCMFSALAQTVASTATAVPDIQSGYYMLLVKSDDGKTDANGNYAYNTSDNYVSYDAKGSTTDFLGKTLTSTDEFAYIFYVEKASDGKISLRAWKDEEHWWKDCGTAKYIDPTPWNKTQFPTSTSKAKFEVLENGFLKVEGSVWTGRPITGKADPRDYYVVCNTSEQMGYAQNSANNKAQFQFYAVNNVPSPKEVVSFTYNYTDGEHSKSVAKNLMLIGYDFPEANDIDFLVGEKPAGKISADDNGKTFDIQCTEKLPFQTSTEDAPIYYYLENVKDNGTRLYANGSSLAFRTAGQAASVNDVRNDLWYVTGNVFDGFKFANVGSGHLLHSYSAVLNAAYLVFTGAMADNTYTWDLIETADGFGVCPIAGSVYSWPSKLTDANKKNYSWKLNDNANSVVFKEYESGNDAFSFRLVPATFTFPMYPVGSNTYNSFAAPFDVTLADANGAVKMYKGTADYEQKELVLTQVDAAPANAGVVLIGENCSDESVTLKVVSGAQELEGNALVGTTVDLAASDLADKLIFGVADGSNDEVGFFSANSSVASLTANHAYINKQNTNAQVLSMRFNGQPTCIGRVNADNKAKGDASIYDLTGRKVNYTVKGQLYIQNGRKFIAQ